MVKILWELKIVKDCCAELFKFILREHEAFGLSFREHVASALAFPAKQGKSPKSTINARLGQALLMKYLELGHSLLVYKCGRGFLPLTHVSSCARRGIRRAFNSPFQIHTVPQDLAKELSELSNTLVPCSSAI